MLNVSRETHNSLLWSLYSEGSIQSFLQSHAYQNTDEGCPPAIFTALVRERFRPLEIPGMRSGNNEGSPAQVKSSQWEPVSDTADGEVSAKAAIKNAL